MMDIWQPGGDEYMICTEVQVVGLRRNTHRLKVKLTYACGSHLQAAPGEGKRSRQSLGLLPWVGGTGGQNRFD